MKKYITLFTFVCVLFLGMQTTSAQETPEIKAKMKTLELAKKVELSDTQVKQVYAIYLAYVKNNPAGNDAALDLARKEISNVLEPRQQREFKTIFTREKQQKRKMETARSGQ